MEEVSRSLLTDAHYNPCSNPKRRCGQGLMRQVTYMISLCFNLVVDGARLSQRRLSPSRLEGSRGIVSAL